MAAITVRSIFARLGFKVDDGPLRRFTGETDKAKRGLEDVERGADKARKSLMSMATDGLAKFDLVSNAISKLAAPIGEVITKGARFESLRAALETAEGGADKAAVAFDRLQKFAASTPFQIDELTESYMALKNQGLDNSERALRAWGDAAAANDKPIRQMVEAVADASRNSFERLKEFGIVAAKSGDQVNFTFKGITTTVAAESGAIQKYLLGLAETNFAGGMERQSATLAGLWSTLQDNVAAAADEIFRAGLGDILKDWVKEATTAAKETAAWISKNKELVKVRVEQFLRSIRDTAKTLWPIIEGVAKAALALVDGLNSIGVGIGPVIVGLGSLRTAIIAATGPWGALAAAGIAAGVAIAGAMADAEKRTESLGRAAGRTAREAGYKASLEGKTAGDLGRMRSELDAERKRLKTIQEDVRGLSPKAIKRLERERQLDVEASKRKQALLEEAIAAAEAREEQTRKEYSEAKAAEDAAAEKEMDDWTGRLHNKAVLKDLRRRHKRGELSDSEIDQMRALEKDVGKYVQKGSSKKPKKEKSLLDLVTGAEAGGGTSAASRGLGTTIINIDARNNITIEVPAPNGLAGESPASQRAIAQNAGWNIGQALEPYFTDQARRIGRVFEG